MAVNSVLQAQPHALKGQALEFHVTSEPWVKYRLEDGTLLFARLIITKIIRTEEYDQSGQPIYAWSSQHMFTTICSLELKGQPSTIPISPTDLNSLKTTPMDLERIGPEEWNVYEISDGSVLRIKLEVTGVAKTDKFVSDGDPFYIVNCQPIPRIKVPTGLLNRQVTKVDTERRALYG